MTLSRSIRLLISGVVLRVVICSVFVPVLHNQWFVPFIQHIANNPSIDPWTSWLNAGGDIAAFPYGVGMILISIPAAFATYNFGISAGSLLLLLVFIILDTIIGYLLIKSGANLAIVCSWIYGPLAIYVTYILGQTDITIAYLVLLVVLLIKANKWRTAGIALGIAVLFKLSALLFLPFVFIFALQSPRERPFAKSFVKSSLFVLTVGMLPMWYSQGFRQMVLFSRETGGLLDYTISFGKAEPLQLVPLVYGAMLYLLWRQGRTTSGVLCVVSVSAFASVAIIAPSSTGWYLWFLPSMLLLSSQISKSYIFATSIFQVLVASNGLIKQVDIETRNWIGLGSLQIAQDSQVRSLVQTLVMVSGILSVIAFLRTSIFSQDKLRIGLKPLTVGIAGDSGSGKSTLTESMVELFPKGSCQVIEGDNYHLYERNAVEWNTVTHLNPMANNLEALESDVQNAKLRRVVKSRFYDHNTGKFLSGDRVIPGDVLIVSGLHSLYINQSDRMFDVGVFLDMNETLREKLKIERDSAARGVSEQQARNVIEKRKSDSDRFIKPQKNKAEVIFYIDIEDGISRDNLRFCCVIRTRSLTFLPRLSGALTSLVLVPHQLSQGNQVGELELWVRGEDLTPLDLMIIARHLDPEICKLFSPSAQFAPGTLGLQCLVVLLAIGEKRRYPSD